MTSEELDDAASIVREAETPEKKLTIAKKLRAEAKKSKEMSKLGWKVAKDEAKEYAKTGAMDRLQILLGREERLLNRVADIYSRVGRFDLTYLEQFETPIARERAIQVLEESRNILDDTIRRARMAQTQKRWSQEWEELRKEKSLPEPKASALPSISSLKKKE